MLCIGDSILSLSLTWFSLVTMSDWSATNVGMCLFQTFAVCYGLVFTYSIVFLVCYERYLVVKNYNFGVQNFFERFKVVIIGGSLSLGFIFTIETVMFIPHQKNITKCTVPQLYGEHFGFFIQFVAGGLTLIMGGIVFYSIRTVSLFGNYFSRHQKLTFIINLWNSIRNLMDQQHLLKMTRKHVIARIVYLKIKLKYHTRQSQKTTKRT